MCVCVFVCMCVCASACVCLCVCIVCAGVCDCCHVCRTSHVAGAMTASGHRLRSAVTQAPDARAAVLRSVGTTTRHRACPPRPRGAGAKPRRSRGGGGQPCGVWWCRRCPAPGQPTSCSCRARPTARGAWSNGARAARGAAGQAAGAQPGPSGPGAPGRPPDRRGGDAGAPGSAKSGPTARATAGSGHTVPWFAP